jgi:hypothetical protein
VSLFPGGYAASAQSAVTRELKRTLELLMAMVALVLIIAASNVTNLLVARGAARARDMAIRLAIGAGRWHLLRERHTPEPRIRMRLLGTPLPYSRADSRLLGRVLSRVTS